MRGLSDSVHLSVPVFCMPGVMPGPHYDYAVIGRTQKSFLLKSGRMCLLVLLTFPIGRSHRG